MDTARAADMRDLLSADLRWTPRQRQVFDCLAAGKSNQQIADELGVSLDGAKWHMREILSKLNVETREDAAEYWRLYNGWRPRLGRAWRGMGASAVLKWSAATLGIAGTVFAAVAFVLSTRGDDSNAGAPAPEATRSATASPTTMPTPAPTPRHIILDGAPQDQPSATTRSIGAVPASVFPPWDGVSTVIYDIERGTAIDLGPGAQPAVFSPDGTKAVWTVGAGFGQGTEAFVLDLVTGERRSLGTARIAGFRDNTHAVVGHPLYSVDLTTGALERFEEQGNWFEFVPAPTPPPGFRIDPPGRTGPDTARLYSIRDSSGATVFTFDAVAATGAGPGELAVVAPPVGGRSNVYIVDIATGAATFVASTGPGSFPFSGTSEAILWTDNYCGEGSVNLFERASGELVRLDLDDGDMRTDDRYAELTPDGDIAIGGFGAKFLVDRETLSYLAVIPPRPDGYGGDVSWSADYRFASHGPQGGHGGPC